MPCSSCLVPVRVPSAVRPPDRGRFLARGHTDGTRTGPRVRAHPTQRWLVHGTCNHGRASVPTYEAFSREREVGGSSGSHVSQCIRVVYLSTIHCPFVPVCISVHQGHPLDETCINTCITIVLAPMMMIHYSHTRALRNPHVKKLNRGIWPRPVSYLWEIAVITASTY